MRCRHSPRITWRRPFPRACSMHGWDTSTTAPSPQERVLVTSWPAHPYDLESRRATVLNVYTDPLYRRRGNARLLMEAMIDWCKHEGFARVNLHASDSSRHLYESLGF